MTNKERNKIYKERYEEKYPFKLKWAKLRYRANKRGIKFTISYEDFRELCIEQEIKGKTGRYGWNLSVDRIDSDKGYEKGNLQFLTVSDNSKKSNIPEVAIIHETPEFLIERKDCPF